MKGKLCIGRVDGPDHTEMKLTIKCASSGVQFLDARLRLEDFMRALAGQGHINCSFELRATDLVGTKCENDQILVTLPIPSYGANFHARMRVAAQDVLGSVRRDAGWTFHESDLAYNMHRISGGKMRVPIHRFVKVAP